MTFCVQGTLEGLQHIQTHDMALKIFSDEVYCMGGKPHALFLIFFEKGLKG